jgi:hypothetical protein
MYKDKFYTDRLLEIPIGAKVLFSGKLSIVSERECKRKNCSTCLLSKAVKDYELINVLITPLERCDKNVFILRR